MRCPRGIKLTEYITKAKKEVVERGFVPQEIKKFLENIQKFGNPFGFRKKKILLERAQIDSEYILFLGCSIVDERILEIARKALELLRSVGINFTVLEDESCCGNDVLAVGEEGLFEHLKDKNLRLFKERKVKKIITVSPHCYNAFKNHYGIETYHISEILAKAIEKAEIKFSKVVEKKVTYHDPCYLGRYNGVYDAPRKILEYIPGIKFFEMNRNRELSICCGGGAGNIVRDLKNPAKMRVDEARSLGVEVLITSCPFCFMMLGSVSKIEVKDLVEIVYDSVFS